MKDARANRNNEISEPKDVPNHEPLSKSGRGVRHRQHQWYRRPCGDYIANPSRKREPAHQPPESIIYQKDAGHTHANMEQDEQFQIKSLRKSPEGTAA